MFLTVNKSDIEGMGLFTLTPISPCVKVLDAGYIRERIYHESEPCAFVNHSDTPNMYVRIEGGAVQFFSKQAIVKDEELTVSYTEVQHLLEYHRVNKVFVGIPVNKKILGLHLNEPQNGQLNLMAFNQDKEHYSHLNAILKKSWRYEGIVFTE